MKDLKSAETTTAPVQSGVFTGVSPEFGRVADVTRQFAIKRGTAYNLLADGKIKGVLLRVRGTTSGVRLFDMASVRAYIHSQSASAEPQRRLRAQRSVPANKGCLTSISLCPTFAGDGVNKQKQIRKIQ